MIRRFVEAAANSREVESSVSLIDALPALAGPHAAPHPVRQIVCDAVSESESQALRTARQTPNVNPADWTVSASDFKLCVGDQLNRRFPVADSKSSENTEGDRELSIRIPIAPIRTMPHEQKAITDPTPRFVCWPRSVGMGLYARHGAALNESVLIIERCGVPLHVDVPLGCAIVYAADIVHCGWSGGGAEWSELCWIHGRVHA